ncbi:MAG: hypothetical protein ACI87V_001714, partial [Flavobacteriales bacterium]
AHVVYFNHLVTVREGIVDGGWLALEKPRVPKSCALIPFAQLNKTIETIKMQGLFFILIRSIAW